MCNCIPIRLHDINSEHILLLYSLIYHRYISIDIKKYKHIIIHHETLTFLKDQLVEIQHVCVWAGFDTNTIFTVEARSKTT